MHRKAQQRVIRTTQNISAALWQQIHIICCLIRLQSSFTELILNTMFSKIDAERLKGPKTCLVFGLQLLLSVSSSQDWPTLLPPEQLSIFIVISPFLRRGGGHVGAGDVYWALHTKLEDILPSLRQTESQNDVVNWQTSCVWFKQDGKYVRLT